MWFSESIDPTWLGSGLFLVGKGVLCISGAGRSRSVPLMCIMYLYHYQLTTLLTCTFREGSPELHGFTIVFASSSHNICTILLSVIRNPIHNQSDANFPWECWNDNI